MNCIRICKFIAAIRRLGGGKSQTTSQRWKAKKSKPNGDTCSTSDEDKQNLLRLTELADKLLQDGQFEIYQDTFEKFNFKLGEQKTTQEEQPVPDDKNDDDALDMFADDIDNKEKDKQQSVTANNEKKDAKTGDCFSSYSIHFP